jgi:tRNA pseudouridine38-40 synthase
MAESWVYHRNCRVPAGRTLPAGVRRFAAVLEYDGSPYRGWQRQAHCASVQHQVESALAAVADEPIAVACAGRTDTGVHATAQVIHFDSAAPRSPDNWLRGANTRLPPAIRLRWVEEVPAGFHARFGALARTYRYLIHQGTTAPAILRNHVCWERRPLDLAGMQAAARELVGERDFSAFQGAGCQSQTPRRHLSELRIWRQGSLVILELTANAFLLHMVRNIAGALRAVGRGERPPEWIGALLESGRRALAPATAPAAGLYLVGVHYPPALRIPSLVGGPGFLDAAPPSAVERPLWERHQ